MQKFIQFCQKHPLLIIAALAAAAVLALLNVGKLRIDSSTKSMMMRDDPALTYYYETCERFGSDMMMIIYVEDEELFSEAKLQRLQALVDDLHQVPGVRRVASLFSVFNLKNRDGMLDNHPLMEQVPASRVEAEAIRDEAIANPLLVDNLISRDGRKTAINLHLQPLEKEGEDLKRATAVAVAGYMEKYRDDFQVLFEVGAPYSEKTMTELIMSDMRVLVPLAFLALLIMLVITTGSLNGAVFPLITSSLSILYTLGFMSFFDLPFNLLTFIIPTLTIVIGSTEDIHILAAYREGLKHYGDRKLAVGYLARVIGTPLLLTALTTFLGFLSISLNRVVALVQFGIVAGFALLINPLVTFAFAPVYFSLFGIRKVRKTGEERGFATRLLAALADRIVFLFSRRPLVVLAGFILLAVGVGLFGYRVEVNNDTTNFFPKDSPVITRTNHLHDQLSGTFTFYIRFSSGRSGTFQNPRYLSKLEAVQELMAAEFDFDKTISIVDYIKLTNQEFNFGDPRFHALPDSEQLIAQYALFLHRDEIQSYVTHDWSEANILVRHNITGSEELEVVVRRLEADIARILQEGETARPASAAAASGQVPGSQEAADVQALIDDLLAQDFTAEAAEPDTDTRLSFGITGETIILNKASDTIALSQVTSIATLLIAIFIIMTVMFTNIKAGLLSLIPNVVPIAVFFGIMGIFNIPLNLGTCMVAAVAIGIAVDDTIHLMTRFNQEMRVYQDKNTAMAAVIRAELRPVVSTSIALALGFAILSRAHIYPIKYFGILSAVVMIFALLADLLLTPVLLASSQFINLSDIAGLKLAGELKGAPIFEGMSMFQIKKFVLLGRVVEKEAGGTIIRFGEEQQDMYILLEGTVRVQRPAEEEGKEVFLAELGVGDVFGEISLLRKLPRSASVVAQGQVSYLQIDWQGFERISRSSRSIANKVYLNLARILAKRLVDMDDRIPLLQAPGSPAAEPGVRRGGAPLPK